MGNPVCPPYGRRRRRYGTGWDAPHRINTALGLPNEARTGLSMLLKVMAAQGLIKRHELGPRWVEYTRLMPLRKRERVARWLWQ